jgi:DDE superfamily endonuclease
MATPYKSVSEDLKDSYNFYHSQLRINIECAFGMLCNHFGILRKAIPSQISIAKTCALVMACCQLHNYCIDNNDDIPQSTDYDAMNISIDGGIPIAVEANSISNIEYQPVQLLDAGNHITDFVLIDFHFVEEESIVVERRIVVKVINLYYHTKNYYK